MLHDVRLTTSNAYTIPSKFRLALSCPADCAPSSSAYMLTSRSQPLLVGILDFESDLDSQPFISEHLQSFLLHSIMTNHKTLEQHKHRGDHYLFESLKLAKALQTSLESLIGLGCCLTNQTNFVSKGERQYLIVDLLDCAHLLGCEEVTIEKAFNMQMPARNPPYAEDKKLCFSVNLLAHFKKMQQFRRIVGVCSRNQFHVAMWIASCTLALLTDLDGSVAKDIAVDLIADLGRKAEKGRHLVVADGAVACQCRSLVTCINHSHGLEQIADVFIACRAHLDLLLCNRRGSHGVVEHRKLMK